MSKHKADGDCRVPYCIDCLKAIRIENERGRNELASVLNTPHKTDALDTELENIDWGINELSHIASSTGDGSYETANKIASVMSDIKSHIQTHYNPKPESITKEAVREAIPKKQNIVTLTEPPQGIDRLWLQGRDTGVTAGYNQAIADFKQALGLEDTQE